MAVTASSMMPLGTQAPDFNLLDTITGESLSLAQLRGKKGTLVVFMCNHCPYVLHLQSELIALAEQYALYGINTLGISANDIGNYPADAPDKMQTLMAKWGNPFAAYLYDETQTVAKAYSAACTPDFYLFDEDLSCVYRGRLDGATPKNKVPVTGEDLRAAVDALLANQPIDSEQAASMGCNIKWK